MELQMSHPFTNQIGLISASDLSTLWGYAGPNSAFREFCTKLSISHVPGRPGWYDPRLVRHRMNEAQGLHSAAFAASVTGGASSASLSLVEQRRARRGTS